LDILGVDFYPVTLEGALSTIDWMLSRQDGCTRLVVTANPIMVITSHRDAEFLHILKNAHLLVPDGIGILWAAKKLGHRLPQRVTGMDLATSLLNRSPSPTFFFLGGKPGVADKARKNLEESLPGLRICGTHHGYFAREEESQIVEMIRKARAEILFVAMGSPRQEKFIWRNRKRLGAKVALGLGGALDILAGMKDRAPEWVQKVGLEWLYRLLLEPGRIKKDLMLLEFVLKVEMAAGRRKLEFEKEKVEGKGAGKKV